LKLHFAATLFATGADGDAGFQIQMPAGYTCVTGYGFVWLLWLLLKGNLKGSYTLEGHFSNLIFESLSEATKNT